MEEHLILVYGYGDISKYAFTKGKWLLEQLHEYITRSEIQQSKGDAVGHVIRFKQPSIEDLVERVEFDISFTTMAFQLTIAKACQRINDIESLLIKAALKNEVLDAPNYELLTNGAKKPMRIYAKNPKMAIELLDKTYPIIRERVFGLLN